jgi:CMP-N,N'-diacetyllegionaminic acid synthase
MHNGKKILAIIPARSGSKGIKDKNIKLLNNKPLMAYSVDAALASAKIDSVIVSTDSESYASIAMNYGAEVPFLRSKENASDQASSMSVVVEVLSNLKKTNRVYDVVVLLQPTSPLRTTHDIDNSIDLLFTKNANAIVSVNKMNHPLQWCNTLPKDFSMHNFIQPEYLNKPRQVIEYTYTLNGAIVVCRSSIINEGLNLYLNGTYAYEMDPKCSIDIDSSIDFDFAEFMINKQLKAS